MYLNEIPDFDFRGIKRIEIPYADKDFASGDYGESILNKYMQRILNTHKQNAKKEKYLYKKKILAIFSYRISLLC